MIMNKLNDEQRKFLLYIQKYHNSVGWIDRVNCVLRDGEYNPWEMDIVLSDWRQLISEDWYHSLYGTPKNYLK